jgi:hypothetical protein
MNREETDKLAYVVVGDEKSENYYRRLLPEWFPEYFALYGEEGFELATTAFEGSVTRSVARHTKRWSVGMVAVESVTRNRAGERRVYGSEIEVYELAGTDYLFRVHSLVLANGIESRIEAMATAGTTTALLEGAL